MYIFFKIIIASYGKRKKELVYDNQDQEVVFKFLDFARQKIYKLMYSLGYAKRRQQ